MGIEILFYFTNPQIFGVTSVPVSLEEGSTVWILGKAGLQLYFAEPQRQNHIPTHLREDVNDKQVLVAGMSTNTANGVGVYTLQN